MKLPATLLWKSVVLEVGVQRLQAHPKLFWFAENLGKSPENPGRKGSNVVWLQKMATKVCIKTHHEDLFLEITPKRGLHDFGGRKFVGKRCTKNFSGMFGEIWAKSFASQKFACSYTYDEKAPPRPLHLFWQSRGGNAFACLHSPASLCILFYTHSLYSLLLATMCHCDEHKLSAVSPWLRYLYKVSKYWPVFNLFLCFTASRVWLKYCLPKFWRLRNRKENSHHQMHVERRIVIIKYI